MAELDADINASVISILRSAAVEVAVLDTTDAHRAVCPICATDATIREGMVRRLEQLAEAAPTVFHAADTGQMVWAAERVATADEAFAAGYSAALEDNALVTAIHTAALPAVLGTHYTDSAAHSGSTTAPVEG